MERLRPSAKPIAAATGRRRRRCGSSRPRSRRARGSGRRPDTRSRRRSAGRSSMNMPRGGMPGRGRRRIRESGRPAPRHGAGSRPRRGESSRARRGGKRRDRVGRPGRNVPGAKLRPVRHRRMRVRRRRFGFPTETRKWRSAWAPDTGRMAGTRRPAWISTHSANGDGCSAATGCTGNSSDMSVRSGAEASRKMPNNRYRFSFRSCSGSPVSPLALL